MTCLAIAGVMSTQRWYDSTAAAMLPAAKCAAAFSLASFRDLQQHRSDTRYP